MECFDGRRTIARPGLSYLPQCISKDESAALIDTFASYHPLWEQRHRGNDLARSVGHGRRLTRPVYWLGAWQFACLGYYSEPEHRRHRCVRAEPIPQLMRNILQRVRPALDEHHGHQQSELPNTCLINYYGKDTSAPTPRDYARLRMHRDHEPGPVIMFCIGQPGLLEFLDPDTSPEPELALWTRHRSVTILSGPQWKERLYHRISQVRTGTIPELHSQLADFSVRRISVSFRSVPDEYIEDFGDLPVGRKELVADYVETLSEHSEHFKRQLPGKQSPI